MDLFKLVVIAIAAGGLTAISPCVLPVLPVVIGGSVGGGRRRPVGIAIGMALTFFVITFTLSSALSHIGIGDNALRAVAVVVLVAFGVILVVPRFEVIASRMFAPAVRLGNRVAGKSGNREGLAGGLMLGSALGLIWTPCAGPILAGVQAALTTNVSRGTAAITLAGYSVGTGVTVLLLGLFGRRLVGRIGPRSGQIRIGIGVLMVVAGGLIAANVDRTLATKVGGSGYVSLLQGPETAGAIKQPLSRLRGDAEDGPGVASAPVADTSGLPDLGPAPELSNISAWYNTPGDGPISIAGLRGRVVLVDFWTYSCVNCLRTLPHLQALDRAYRNKGLTIVGVHTPEFAFEADPGNVRDAVKRLGVTWPVALDPTFATFQAYRNQYWPAEYLIDRDGRVRDIKAGEGNYELSEERIRSLLALPAGGAAERNVSDETPREVLTPESYLGYERLARFVSPGGVTPDKPKVFAAPVRLKADEIGYRGRWTVRRQWAEAGEGAALEMNFHAGRVFLVLASPAGPRTVRVSVDGAPAAPGVAGVDVGAGGSLPVSASRLYELVRIPGPAKNHRLTLNLSAGVRAYAFTFG